MVLALKDSYDEQCEACVRLDPALHQLEAAAEAGFVGPY